MGATHAGMRILSHDVQGLGLHQAVAHNDAPFNILHVCIQPKIEYRHNVP